MFEVFGPRAHNRNIFRIEQLASSITNHPSLLEQFSPDIQQELRGMDAKIGLYGWTLRRLRTRLPWGRSQSREVLRRIMENITASERLLQAVGLGYRPYEHSRDEFLGVLNSVDHPLYFGGELVEPAAKLVSAAQDTKLFDTFAAVYTPQEAEEAAQRIKADVRVAGYIRWPYGSEPLTIFHSGEDRLLRQYRINRGAGVRNGAGFLIYDPRESSELFEPKTTNLSARLMKDIGGIPGF